MTAKYGPIPQSLPNYITQENIGGEIYFYYWWICNPDPDTTVAIFRIKPKQL